MALQHFKERIQRAEHRGLLLQKQRRVESAPPRVRDQERRRRAAQLHLGAAGAELRFAGNAELRQQHEREWLGRPADAFMRAVGQRQPERNVRMRLAERTGRGAGRFIGQS